MKKTEMERVVVGLSGGVDSSVAAYLLKEQGYEVVGMFMRNWHDTTGVLKGNCPFDDDRDFAEMVARKLRIPFEFVDLSNEYRQRVVDYMFNEYSKGRTPNPDVLCNREIKFDAFVKAAFELGADYVATGHYCRKQEIEVNGQTYYRLLTGTDSNKDQSYFLCQLSQQQLSRALFPIGHLLKPEVRKIASELGLATAERKDSQGICFVGKVDLPVFLQQKIKAVEGDIVEIPRAFYSSQPVISPDDLEALCKPTFYSKADGNLVGQHHGAQFFTIGQRKGLNVGGKSEPLFVIATDVLQNVVYTGMGDDHPGLYRKGLFVSQNDVHYIRPDQKLRPGQTARLMVRIRYRQPLQKATLLSRDNGIYIIFDNPQRGVTAGQFAAWYDNEELIGSGVIAM
ncbi:MAG TPA: tRNA 2-thiouridine(34) synthase MnmA [Tenuifilaceae bacterium]|nr:tRNA 2-thiouridine(34) synthase MnmA [Tenuifilaceae bacterium]HOG71254.1 tRNA 2-thiouridine(34) synthase MnmA [Tenuifilaceae bacterium]HOW20961.1 tRNA 2-thiouridine(34) synthase MnmA [Tenuifilaceae bacterium]HPM89280.1 tRNA 2-thiouridine(34) synthase MnmA [Tenuifilaceae bacterium]HQM05235.1 tRNA 2-thiouridine(34) synthase MnmA [Tenuifilaceae bacterium]